MTEAGGRLPAWLVYSGLYAALFTAVLIWGPGVELSFDYTQLLPEAALRERFWESMLHLHGQPPLLNAELGLLLRLEAVSGAPVAATLALLHFAMGWAVVVCLARLARALLPLWAERVVLGLILLHPYLYTALLQSFYTAHEVFFLSTFAFFGYGYRRDGRPWQLVAAAATICALSLTRSLFHPIASLGLLSLVALPSPGRGPSAGPVRPALVLGVATLVLLAWPLKNLVTFGFFGYSSWQGHNLSRQLPLERPELFEMFRFGGGPRAAAARAEGAERVPEAFRDVPVLTQAVKPSGRPNWNHYAMIPYSSEMQERALELLREQPEAFLHRAWRHYRISYGAFAGRRPYPRELPSRVRGTWVGAWMRAYEAIVFLDFHPQERGRGGFVWVFPLLLGLALVEWWRAPRSPESRLVTLMLCSALWVLAMVLCVDGAEGNRMRFSTEPFLLLVFAWGVVGALRRHARVALLAGLVACGQGPEPGQAPDPGAAQAAKASPTSRIPADTREQLRALGYADWGEGDATQSGVTVHDRSRAHAGYNLYSLREESRALLLDMEGRVVHAWSHPALDGGWHHVELDPSGNLYVVGRQSGYLAKLGPDSDLHWKVEGLGAHHDLARGEAGEVFVIGRDLRDVVVGDVEVPILEDFVVRISGGGEVLSRHSLFDVFAESIPPDRLERLAALDLDKASRREAREAMDLLHTNTIEWIEREIPGVARPGDFLLCMPRIGLLAVVDLESGQVRWSWGTGVLDGPHEPTVVEDGHILVFDNGRRRGWSRVLEVDPRSEQIVWEYRGDPPSSFFTISQGGNQKLPNGNLLLTESTRGRAFELARDGTVVWEFFNPQISEAGGKGRRAVIYRMTRHAPELVRSWLPGVEGPP